MSEIFQLYECGDVFQFTDPADSYQTWQGLQGPKGDPGEPGPPGQGLTISGTVATVGDLPASAEQGTVYNVGAEAPYELYMYEVGTGWISLGYLEGPEGPAGTAAGFGTPTISVGSGTGTPSATVTASGPDTAKVFAFAFDNLKGAQGDPGAAGQDGADGVSPEVTITSITGGHTVTITDADHPTGQSFNVMDGEDGAPGQGVPSGGTAGQVLTKDSSTDYDTSWADPEAGGINRNLLDNWYFVGGGSQSGWGIFPINQRGQATYTPTGSSFCVDRWKVNLPAGSSVTVTLEASDLLLTITDAAANKGTGLMQFLSSSYAGKKLTLSILVSDINGSLNLSFRSVAWTVYGSSDVTTAGLHTLTCTVPSDATSPLMIHLRSLLAQTLTVKILAMKLELGDAQTLAHQENGTWVINEIPDYEEQLIQCITSHADSGDTYANRVVAYTDQALPTGGSAGQVLAKASGTDYDTTWITPADPGGALYFPSVAMTATTGTIISISNAAITADYVLASVVFSKPAAVTAGGTFSSGAGTFTMTGTCTDATCTAQITLVKKSN